MKVGRFLVLASVLAMINACGDGTDRNIIATPNNLPGVPVNNPYPYPPGGNPGVPTNFPSASCPTGQVYNPGTSFVYYSWFGGAQYTTNVPVCSGAEVTIRGKSKDNIFISNGNEVFYFNKSEINDGGKTVDFDSFGSLYWGCESDCSKLDITFYEFSIRY